jgi:hypothetical protein
MGVLKLKSQLIACADLAIHRVTHLGLFVLEAIGQRDVSPVFFTVDLKCSNGFTPPDRRLLSSIVASYHRSSRDRFVFTP